jgi:hypothetical protein
MYHKYWADYNRNRLGYHSTFYMKKKKIALNSISNTNYTERFIWKKKYFLYQLFMHT